MQKHNGFTLIELVIVVSITAVLTTMVTINFRQARSSQEVSAAGADFISKIREVQSFIQTGKLVTGQTEAADAYQIVLTTGSNTYRIDRDINSVINVLETVSLTTNMRVSQVYINNVAVANTTLRITAPFAKILADGNANRVVKIDLTHTITSDRRTVIIDGISGRIGLE